MWMELNSLLPQGMSVSNSINKLNQDMNSRFEVPRILSELLNHNTSLFWLDKKPQVLITYYIIYYTNNQISWLSTSIISAFPLEEFSLLRYNYLLILLSRLGSDFYDEYENLKYIGQYILLMYMPRHLK